MKKTVLALLMAFVMLTNFSMILKVMAHDADVSQISTRVVCPICYGTRTYTYCSKLNSYYNIYDCNMHPGCQVIEFHDYFVTSCYDCGYVYSSVDHIHNVDHNSINK